LFVVLLVIDPTSHELGSPAKPGRFNSKRSTSHQILDIEAGAQAEYPICCYGALTSDGKQLQTINTFVKEFGAAISYLFYNPAIVPDTMTFPSTGYRILTKSPSLGARVVDARDVHAVLARMKNGQAPTLSEIIHGTQRHRRLEEWAEELLRCKVGVPFDRSMDQLVERLLSRRSGPIGAVVAFSVALPDED